MDKYSQNDLRQKSIALRLRRFNITLRSTLNAAGQIVVPEAMISRVLDLVHSLVTAGNYGERKMYAIMDFNY